jgi:hypothetical protein
VSTLVQPRPTAVRTDGLERLLGPSLVLGGVAFFVGGLTHPRDSGHGNKVQQLHDMLVDSSWYPSHAALLVAMVAFAAGIYVVRRRRDLSPGVDRVVRAVLFVACLAVVSMVVHLLAALGASSVADGRTSLLSRVQAVNEAIDAAWGVALATLAVVGGVTRSVGNRLTAPFGLVGGVAFALGSATIPYTDTFDAALKVGSLLSVWAVVAGMTALRARG